MVKLDKGFQTAIGWRRSDTPEDDEYQSGSSDRLGVEPKWMRTPSIKTPRR